MRAPVRGLALIDKPPGITSFSALDSLKKMLQTRQIGHTGTLDKFASGLLVVLTGRYTRLADLFSGLDKSYRATFTFGVSTDTLDPEGEKIEEGPLPSLQRVRAAAEALTGASLQEPPAYSALKVSGQRASAIARAGGRPPLQAREVIIHRIDILSYTPPDLQVEIDCSKGTYIRALARDLGHAVGSCAFVSGLRRTRVGEFRVEEAVSPQAFYGRQDLLAAEDFLARLRGLGSLRIRNEYVDRVRRGARIDKRFLVEPPPGPGLYALFDGNNELLAVADVHEEQYSYKAVLAD